MADMQKDLVLSINEYAYVLDRTKGNVSCWVGPAKTSLSTSDELVNFNERTKKFEPCGYEQAIHLFTTAPENWYVILKNPAANDKHPNVGTANSLPDKIDIGRKVNIQGPVTFALYPGQMAKVIRGHALRSNQYLLARVYEAKSANASEGEMLDADGNKIETKNKNYVNGQILVIKGTEVSFYIPPTGIEVIAIENKNEKGYVREAVTLERLEYCILKDEDGNKRYVHGPEVVFPEPTETFVESPNGSYIFRAIELSKISGIYAKVIAAYEENGVKHPVGEELFITGNDQMIYYPRPEHAIINYDGKMMHHAIAIPEGEGRYIMNRLTGEIKTVKGPAMYLPDPRTEVVVKRKLTPSQCELWFPGNREALAYNEALNEKAVEKGATRKGLMADLDGITAFASTLNTANTLASLEAKANISRGTSYTKPRTITLDNKYDGVVSVDVWTGYAVNVVSKSGKREVVCGPKTILLDYDQTFEVMEMSTGKPKSTDNLLRTVYLRHENNQVSDVIMVETKDFVQAQVKVSYCVSFDPNAKDKWFKVENYVKYLTDHMRSLIKREAKKYTIEEFYDKYIDIVRNIAINKSTKNVADHPDNRPKGRYFEENGMYVHDCEVLQLTVQRDIARLLDEHQQAMVAKALELSHAEARVKVAEELSRAEKKEQDLRTQQTINKMELQQMEAEKKLEIQALINRKQEAEKVAAQEAEKALQPLLDEIQKAKLAREKLSADAKIEQDKAKAEIEKTRQATYAETIATVMKSIGPDLVAALNSTSNAQVLEAVTQTMAPYALARGESVAEFTDTLLRGTTLEGILKDVVQKNNG